MSEGDKVLVSGDPTPPSLSLSLSRSILVLEREQPHQVCYNGSLPLLFTTCEPSKNSYCSTKSPEYGCTRDLDNACTDFHFCNTPHAFFVVIGILVVILGILLISGCLWCCFCCCCGRCCNRCCPCFARMRRYNEVSPIGTPGFMYQGLDSLKGNQGRVMHSPVPSAPPPFT